MLYASLGGPPAWLEEVQGLLAALPLDRARAQGGPDYVVEAHFLLWLENYLEGLHIPFVHPALARSLDLGRYRQRQTSWGTVQVGVGEAGSPGLPLPVGHPDRASADEVIAGYYLYIFPGIALNLYPWGLSLNAIWPEGPARTRVVYRRYVWAPELCGTGAGGDLHQVELEDDAAVESVQRGLRSRLYRPGRLHPTEEAGLLWLHDRLEEAMRG
jgi:choline monooxygenase